MAQVTLRINGHAYPVGCEDGQEPHLMAMAEAVEQRIERAKALGVPSGEARLLVMAALFMADELHDMGLTLEKAQKAKPEAKSETKADAKPADRAKAERLNRLATRAEEIAASAERH